MQSDPFEEPVTHKVTISRKLEPGDQIIVTAVDAENPEDLSVMRLDVTPENIHEFKKPVPLPLFALAQPRVRPEVAHD